MKRKIAKALLEATQAKIADWFQAIDTAVTSKAQALLAYEDKKQAIMPKLIEAHEKGVSLRELSRILGIPHQTIAKWLKQAEQPQNAKAQ